MPKLQTLHRLQEWHRTDTLEMKEADFRLIEVGVCWIRWEMVWKRWIATLTYWDLLYQCANLWVVLISDFSTVQFLTRTWTGTKTVFKISQKSAAYIAHNMKKVGIHRCYWLPDVVGGSDWLKWITTRQHLVGWCTDMKNRQCVISLW